LTFWRSRKSRDYTRISGNCYKSF